MSSKHRNKLSKNDERTRVPTKAAPREDSTTEDDLLASVSAHVTLTDTYESSVLRQATLSTAPMLSNHRKPTSDDDDDGGLEAGFPGLERLLGGKGTAGVADVPTVRTVLSRVRQETAASTNRNDGLADSHHHQALVGRVKEQLLLLYLQNVARLKPEDMPVNAAVEERQEMEQRQQVLARGTTTTTSRDLSASSVPSQPHNKAKAVRFTDTSPTTAEGRLEAIKQQQLQQQQEGTSSTTTKSRRRRRKSLMQHKQQERDNRPDNNEDDETERQERIQRLKERRQERQALQRKRRKAWIDQPEEEEEASESSDEEHELTFEEEGEDDEEEPPPPPQDSGIDETHQLSETASSFVACPICAESVEVEPNADGDAVLSQHMDVCQRRGSRRSRRQGQPAPSYKEEANDSLPSSNRNKPGKRSSAQVVSKKSTTASRKKPRRSTLTNSAARTPAPSVDDLQEWVYEDRVDAWMESGLDKMKDMAERDQTETPPGAALYSGNLVIPAWVNNRLFAYQRTGLRWMWELHQQEAGAILGDEMGLGKTVQICAYLGSMTASRKLKSVLVVCPGTMMSHWLSELAKWAPGLRRVLIHSSGEVDGLSRSVSPQLLRGLDKWLRQARADRVNEAIDEEDFDMYDENRFCGTGYAVITTYENLRRTPDTWVAHNWSYAILDEGQKIRNPDADVTLACKRIRTPHRLLLSGTPIQNDLRSLWSLFDFVFPGRLGTLPAFEAEFADPIRRGGYSNASPMQVQLAYRCALTLRDLINPYLLRRQKKDIGEVSRMPGKTEQVLFCRLSQRQRALYEAYLRSDAVVGVLRGSTQLLSAVTVLRKICNHPDLVCGPDQASLQSFVRDGYTIDNPDYGADSEDDEEDWDNHESLVERAGKLEVLAKILPLWRKQGHRVLVFCQWRKMLNIIQSFTQQQGWKFARLDGNTNVAARQRLVDAFNTDESYFGMLLTTRTGGVGLNLTGADRIILYDPDWNPMTDAQARERSWRFGQTKAVTVYRLITAGTIEEKIYQRQIFKTALTNRVLQDPKQRRLFSQRDLRDLFTLKADTGSVESGGSGFTETGELTKGTGVVDPDETDSGGVPGATDDNAEKDNVDALQSVLKSKGLAGVFDHDVVDGASNIRKSATIREMEEKAKSVAREAAKALKESASGSEAFQPTWTGSEETQNRRFGGNRTVIASSGTSAVAGVVSQSSNGSAPASSATLLANLRKRNDPKATGDTSQYTVLLRRVRDFVRRNGGQRAGGGPSTDDILREFDSVPSSDAAIFRRLLNSVAYVDNGRWRLKG